MFLNFVYLQYKSVCPPIPHPPSHRLNKDWLGSFSIFVSVSLPPLFHLLRHQLPIILRRGGEEKVQETLIHTAVQEVSTGIDHLYYGSG